MSAQTPDLHVPDLEARITPGLEVVERRLLEAVSSSRDLIDEMTRHLAVAGGKRMRPLLTLVIPSAHSAIRSSRPRRLSS